MLHIKQTATTNNWLTNYIAQLTQTHDTSRPADILKLLEAGSIKENNNKTKQNKNKNFYPKLLDAV